MNKSNKLYNSNYTISLDTTTPNKNNKSTSKSPKSNIKSPKTNLTKSPKSPKTTPSSNRPSNVSTTKISTTYSPITNDIYSDDINFNNRKNNFKVDKFEVLLNECFHSSKSLDPLIFNIPQYLRTSINTIDNIRSFDTIDLHISHLFDCILNNSNSIYPNTNEYNLSARMEYISDRLRCIKQDIVKIIGNENNIENIIYSILVIETIVLYKLCYFQYLNDCDYEKPLHSQRIIDSFEYLFYLYDLDIENIHKLRKIRFYIYYYLYLLDSKSDPLELVGCLRKINIIQQTETTIVSKFFRNPYFSDFNEFTDLQICTNNSLLLLGSITDSYHLINPLQFHSIIHANKCDWFMTGILTRILKTIEHKLLQNLKISSRAGSAFNKQLLLNFIKNEQNLIHHLNNGIIQKSAIDEKEETFIII